MSAPSPVLFFLPAIAFAFFSIGMLCSQSGESRRGKRLLRNLDDYGWTGVRVHSILRDENRGFARKMGHKEAVRFFADQAEGYILFTRARGPYHVLITRRKDADPTLAALEEMYLDTSAEPKERE